MRKRNKKMGIEKATNDNKKYGAFGKPTWQRTEENLEKRRIKPSYVDRKNKPESFMEKISNFLGINSRRK